MVELQLPTTNQINDAENNNVLFILNQNSKTKQNDFAWIALLYLESALR